MQYTLVDLIETFECTFRARVSRLSACNQVHVTPFQAKVLLLVERNMGCSQQVIADLLFRDKAQVARTVKELELLNLVYKTTTKPGGRMFRLRLTTEGNLACDKINHFRRTTMKDMLYSMTRDDQDSLTRLLSNLVKSVSEDLPKFAKPHSSSDEFEHI